MIQRLSHTTLFVTDQEAARDFYVNRLGLELRTDQTMGNYRWLTVGPKGQSEMEIILMKVGTNCSGDQEAGDQLRSLLERGKLGSMGVFETADIHKTHEELAARGVEFAAPPEDKFYGIEAVFKDNSGNRFSLTQRK